MNRLDNFFQCSTPPPRRRALGKATLPHGDGAEREGTSAHGETEKARGSSLSGQGGNEVPVASACRADPGGAPSKWRFKAGFFRFEARRRRRGNGRVPAPARDRGRKTARLPPWKRHASRHVALQHPGRRTCRRQGGSVGRQARAAASLDKWREIAEPVRGRETPAMTGRGRCPRPPGWRWRRPGDGMAGRAGVRPPELAGVERPGGMPR